MKKRLLSTLLTMCIAVGMLPTTAFASTFDPSQPELLGTVSDYQSTLNTMYDENGLRVVNVGFKSSSGDLGVKYGIINRDGNWVAQPIYDKIKPIATDYRLNGGKGARTPATPFYFIGGYVQVVRDGKMGLMNTNGEEVIPCQYDLVQMPSEGMAAVYNKTGSGSTCYLGYWSLAQTVKLSSRINILPPIPILLLAELMTRQARSPRAICYRYTTLSTAMPLLPRQRQTALPCPPPLLTRRARKFCPKRTLLHLRY
ncbi:WG repeat-containing protein [Butyricicoccus sp. Marseille-Q5471]|uniref:WG repeat-containing protein n=1 Tax=Butyricicoccus sp. Marseille-Q5471 TaxID=3039493 RepID=UPI0024BC0A22|nr:WG repeat-containing protein [Butyricicoccus sp. Marseille-Q5471]